MFFALLFLAAFIVGFCVRRGGICLVGATLEIYERQHAQTLLFILEATTVSFIIVVSSVFLFPSQIHFAGSYPLSLLFVFGALLYGLGAGINGGCAIGTINKLMGGQFNFIGTIFGIAAGFLLFLLLEEHQLSKEPMMVMRYEELLYVLIPSLILAWGFILYRFWQFFMLDKISISTRIHTFAKAPIARNLVAVFLLGFGSGSLYLMLGHAWDYSNWIMTAERMVFHSIPISDHFIYVSISTAGLLTGIFSAVIFAKAFHFVWPDLKSLLIKFVGGSLMGVSAGFIHGGNDTLLLHGLPTMAFHAPFAILLIMFTVLLLLSLRARFFAKLM